MYIVYALPRSRTYWLSRFLTYSDWHCSHDELLHARSMEDIKAWLEMPNTGTIETLAAPFWRMVKDLQTVVIRRPLDDVIESLHMLGMVVDRPLLERLDHKLDQIECRVPNVLSVNFDDLRSEQVCRQIFEFCLPYQHDHKWWTSLNGMNMQINFPTMLRYYEAYAPQLNRLGKIAKHHCIAAMHLVAGEFDGVTIQQEPFAIAYRDGAKMYANHCVLVGETPDAFAQKNLPLMQTLDEQGMLQVTTARCNGRLFGYLVAVISPSLEAPDLMCAIHTMFYCEPTIKGLGMKLQRSSVNALSGKGIGEVYFHSGVRGDGPRMGTLFKRLGAEQYGNVYKLKLSK